MSNIISVIANEHIEENKGWKITDAVTADWALDKIREAKAEYNQKEMIVREKIRQLEEWLEKERAERDRTVNFFTAKLQEYFETAPKKRTKTQEILELPTGTLIGMVRYAIQEPPKRRLRIKNKIRFIVFILLVVLTILVFVIPRQGHSNSEYKPYKVAFGDTYWHIARQLQEAGYRPRADIREIVHELVELSGIKAHELKEGDIIYMPELGE